MAGCRICRLPIRSLLEKKLRAGQSVGHVARAHSLSKSTLWRHATLCIPEREHLAQYAQQARAGRIRGPVQINVIYGERGVVLDELANKAIGYIEEHKSDRIALRRLALTLLSLARRIAHCGEAGVEATKLLEEEEPDGKTAAPVE